eukprot:NODE_1537_length_1133_cov_86.693727_g1250_i0.p4 GENE.NODE_1537_length_1133_cov_86.693727_g1250_i0~~NODE_1537_length_1133_cov_86.693727_g1250_i0.p4  ORF type:complete len:98 (+),score=23.44 NODE_1537_length_1133_cov_86.693727_g1250_i0:789-1082(+)
MARRRWSLCDAVCLNLSWCITLTDNGVCPVIQECTQLQLLSLHGILGVTGRCVEALQQYNRGPITDIDLVGCTNVPLRSRSELQRLFPSLRRFLIHT